MNNYQLLTLASDSVISVGYLLLSTLFATAPLWFDKKKLSETHRRFVQTLRYTIIAFFVFCGLTHAHRVEHNITAETPAEIAEWSSPHQAAIHIPQAISVWVVVILLFRLPSLVQDPPWDGQERRRMS